MFNLAVLTCLALIVALNLTAIHYRRRIAALAADREALIEDLAEATTEQALLEDLLTAALRENAQGAR